MYKFFWIILIIWFLPRLIKYIFNLVFKKNNTSQVKKNGRNIIDAEFEELE